MQVGVGTEGKTSAELLRCILHLPGLVLMLRAMGSLPGIGVGSGTQRTLAAYWGTWPVKAMGPGAPLPSLSSGVGGTAPGSAAKQGNGAELVAGQGQTVRELAFSITFSTLSK